METKDLTTVLVVFRENMKNKFFNLSELKQEHSSRLYYNEGRIFIQKQCNIPAFKENYPIT